MYFVIYSVVLLIFYHMMTSNQNKNLLDRLMILEKLIELKSNECAYYRTKVHIMQMSSLHTRNIKNSLVNEQDGQTERSSSKDTSQNSIVSQNQTVRIDKRHRRHSVSVQQKSSFRKVIL